MTTVTDGQVIDPTEDAPGAWLPIPAAAHMLGVGERTVRRRIERGQLRRRVHQDGHVEVWVPMAAPDGVSPNVTDSDGQDHALVLVERYTELVAAHTAPLVARIEELARENGHLAERVRQLEAEREADRHMSVMMTDTPSWWRRWRAWLAAGLAVAVVGSASCQTAASVKNAGLCTSARA